MSIWTRVVGNIRIDGLPSFGNNIEEIEKIIGPICLWNKWNEKSKLPRGSEGSLQYKIIEYEKGMPWLTVPIWGDLRDFYFEDVEKIKVWWFSLLKELNNEDELYSIRDAVLKIDSEDKTTTTIILTEEEVINSYKHG